MPEDPVNPFNSVKVLAHRDRLAAIMDGRLPPPVTVEIDLADGFCNHSCPHCFFATPGKKSPVFFPLERAASLAEELHEAGVRALEFPGGGEPTTHPEFAGIIRAFARAGLPMGLVSNGQLARRVLPVLRLFEWVRVSLDAGDAATYQQAHGVDQFEAVLAAIGSLAREAARTTVGVGCGHTPELGVSR
ncbi:radical SAM protein [Streptomyces tibetensis]|uniref:radical SAM protein n=1 Tax=Streptomyces tibetensis TaxID=2382123 RepID=UPI00381E9F57